MGHSGLSADLSILARTVWDTFNSINVHKLIMSILLPLFPFVCLWFVVLFCVFFVLIFHLYNTSNFVEIEVTFFPRNLKIINLAFLFFLVYVLFS